MTRGLRAFGTFWYEFVIGGDWRIAMGVVAAPAVTFGFSRAGLPSWWVLPTALLMLVALSLWTIARGRR